MKRSLINFIIHLRMLNFKTTSKVDLNYPTDSRLTLTARGIIGPDWGFIGSGVGNEGADDFRPS